MNLTTCPPPELLKDYLSGKLDEEASEVMSAHLENCDVCELTATNFDRDPDTLVELLQADLQSEPLSGDGKSFAVPNSVRSFSLTMPRELGQYELKSRLGTGGMGTVYLALHRSLNKQVAIKLLPALPAQNAEFVARFQREMRAAGQLDHPAIVRATDAGEQQGVHFLVMDAIDGMNLSSIAKAEDKLTVADACEVVRQASVGLAYAHEKGIVHRDVKPSNLMLNTNGKVLILDFGLAQIGLWDTGSAEITTVGQLMGTLDYMAPEQAERGGAVDYRADLYSLGATLFRLLTGRAPLAAAPNLTPLEKLRLLATHKPPKLRSLRNDIPERLGEIVDNLLARDPCTRPASATHIAELLEPFCKNADLESLIRRVRSRPELSSDIVGVPSLPLPFAPAITTPEETKPNAQLPKISRGSGGWLTWLALAGCMAMFAAGIVFIIETRKGQLVIDSESDVQIKITKVDDNGEQTEVEELQIEPGTRTTRLRSGNYAIMLDAPSDSFGVTNGIFTIRNGQTVVATITSKPASSAHATLAEPQISKEATIPSADRRLNQIVYDGKTLDEWLRQLNYERNAEQIKVALDAVYTLSRIELRDAIEPILVDFIIDSKSPEKRHQAFHSLAKCTGDEYPNVVAKLMEKMENEQEQLQIASLAYTPVPSTNVATVQVFDSVLGKFSKLLSSRDTQIVLDSAILLRAVADTATGEAANDLQQRILKMLKETTSLDNESFWLAYPAQYYSFDVQGRSVGGIPSCDAMKVEIFSRTLAAITDPASSDQAFIQAVIVLRTFLSKENTLSHSQLQAVAAPVKEVITTLARSPQRVTTSVNVPASLRDWSSPSSSLARWVHFRGATAFKAVVTLNLIDAAGMADQVLPELEELFETFRSLPLSGKSEYQKHRILMDNAEDINEYHWSWTEETEQSPEFNLNRFVYLQTGDLLGKSTDELFARFDQKLPADIQRETNEFLDRLASSDYRLKLRLMVAQSRKQVTYPDRALELIEKFFTQHASNLPTSQLNIVSNVWIQAASDDFLSSYTNALRNADAANRERLLSLDFEKLEGFQCTNSDALLPLLEWSDETVKQLNDPQDERLWNVVRMLASIALNESQVSTECQKLVVSHLENYPLLTNADYWFALDLSSLQETSENHPLRLAQLRRSVAQLSENAGDPKMFCIALSLIARDAGQLELFSESELAQLAENFRNKLQTVIADPKAHSFVMWINGPLSTFGPHFGNQTLNLEGAHEPECPTNAVLLTLNALSAFQVSGQQAIADRLMPLIESLHGELEQLNLTGKTGVIGTTSWYGFFGPRVEGQPNERMLHVWYVQTGALLGKDIKTLNERPRKLYEEELERTNRFIQPSDTLAIHIPQVLPLTGEPPVIQAGTQAPVVGFPIPVSFDGEIQLPFIKPVVVKNLELKQALEKIQDAYVSSGVLKAGYPLGISVQFLLRSGQQLELRNIAGNTSVSIPETAPRE